MMKRSTPARLLGSALAAAVLCASALAATAQPLQSGKAAPARSAKAGPTNNAWIVQLADAPVTAYTGGIKGLQATKPRPGQKIDPNAPAVVSYMSYLQSKQDTVLNSVGGGRKLHSYGYVFNGFAADLTAEQAAKLAKLPGVLAVSKDEMRRRSTATTPEFLGLSGPNGFWATKATGENVVIGIIDSGIWPENPSFSDRIGSNGNASKDGKLAYQQIPGWSGRCVPGDEFAASHCNQKLIGARYYNAGFGGNAGVKAEFPYEFNSPRDADGHGSHTASTAGGNANTPVDGPASAFGSVSGIAPRARVAAYKVCWGNNGEGGCFNSDSVAAIDQAVADGVDVINFSISGTSTNFLDPVEVAFLFAADAGVFVAASAGNSGPGASTVAHPSPWITTVAAGTHNRQVLGSTTLGNGSRYEGASAATSAVGSSPLVYSGAAGLSGAQPSEVALCYPGTLDPQVVTGKIVVCDRGAIARTDKSLAVKQAGGVGMILVNTGPSSLNADFHSVPTVHLDHSVRADVVAYAQTQGATASIDESELNLNAAAPNTADFSSRGPLLAGGGDLLKPDLIAPGVDILAAVSPVGTGGRNFDLLSGTSMSSPHVAGLAALMKELKPGWSPMAIKSALMTTASDTLDGPNPFAQGAGHVQPNAAANPGLVYDSRFNQWLGFLCGTGQLTASYCPSIKIDPSDLNVPSIAIGSLAGQQTVKRRVTNVSGGTLTMTAEVSGVAGIDVTVSPSSLTLANGEWMDFTVTFTSTAAATLNAYAGGQLTWSGDGHTVRSPIVVKPVALAAPAQVSGSYDVSFGYTGPFTVTPRGLVPATQTPGNVVDDPANDINTALGTGVGVTYHFVNVPAGTTYARFALFDANTDGNDDLDLYVFRPNFSYYGGSGSGTSAEEVNVENPVAGNWLVVVHGWQTDGVDSNYTLFSWTLGNADAGNMTVTAPASASLGATGTISLGFTGLTPATKYLGSITYGGAAGMPAPTIVRVDGP